MFDEGYDKQNVIGSYTVWCSKRTIDDRWDNFLCSARDGQHEQTSRWADCKKNNSWKNKRIIITKDGNIVGGFQILYKKKWVVGNIGYISKGPVLIENNSQLLNLIIQNIKLTAEKYHISLLLIHPSNNRYDISHRLENKGFLKNKFNCVVSEATQRINLDYSEDELFKKMKRQKRQNIKKAIKKGVNIREGERKELKTFFQYMLKTCERQGVKPNPSKLECIEKIWDHFSTMGNIRLFLSELNDKIISGILSINFGETAYLWKFAWSGEHGDCRPNDLLFWETFRWAKRQGLKNIDLVSVSKKMTEKCSRKETNTNGSSFFKSGFGGEFLPLPEEKIYIYKKTYKIFYSVFLDFPSLSVLKKKIFGKINISIYNLWKSKISLLKIN